MGLRGKIRSRLVMPLRRRWREDVVAPSRALTGRLGPLPSFLVIGAAKAGTTSLFDYLVRHPLVAKPLMKEVHYFDVEYARGLRWYRATFPRHAVGPHDEGAGETRPISGEASPYYIFHPAVPERVAHDLGPGSVKLVALLRNPVDRAYSHYHHEVRHGHESRSFEEALDREAERLEGEEARLRTDPTYHSEVHRWYSYRSRGLYAEQLARWFDRFPREDLLVLPSERLFRETGEVLQEVFDHLGLPPAEVPHEHVANPGGYDPIDPATRERLAAWYEPHNERLYELVGERFDW